jgi:hypothetical protein
MRIGDFTDDLCIGLWKAYVHWERTGDAEIWGKPKAIGYMKL